MNAALILLLLGVPQTPDAAREARIAELIADIGRSGRALEPDGTTDERLTDPRRQIPPGPPPLMAFRYFDGAERHRFGKLDLMLDDAGH